MSTSQGGTFEVSKQFGTISVEIRISNQFDSNLKADVNIYKN